MKKNEDNKIICPYNKDHKLLKTQYERHLKKCANRPKAVKKDINNEKDDKNKNDNNGNNNLNNENKNNNEFLDDEKNSESYNINPNPVIEVKNSIFDDKYDGNVFEEEDYIFKQCYI